MDFPKLLSHVPGPCRIEANCCGMSGEGYSRPLHVESTKRAKVKRKYTSPSTNVVYDSRRKITK